MLAKTARVRLCKPWLKDMAKRECFYHMDSCAGTERLGEWQEGPQSLETSVPVHTLRSVWEAVETNKARKAEGMPPYNRPGVRIALGNSRQDWLLKNQALKGMHQALPPAGRGISEWPFKQTNHTQNKQNWEFFCQSRAGPSRNGQTEMEDSPSTRTQDLHERWTATDLGSHCTFSGLWLNCNFMYILDLGSNLTAIRHQGLA